MKALAVANAVASVLLLLLGLAPFTPALALFSLTVPLAALTARRGPAGWSLVPVLAWLAALGTAPGALQMLSQWPFAAWALALGACAAYVAVRAFWAQRS